VIAPLVSLARPPGRTESPMHRLSWASARHLHAVSEANERPCRHG
jgi:hypothetical protein